MSIPYKTRSEKEAYVRDLFATIAPRYDLLNGVLSLNRHKKWRREAVRDSRITVGQEALDVCTGTGDLAFELAKRAGKTGRVAGIDFAPPMVEIAKSKADKKGLSKVSFMVADACSLPFADNSFDCATIAFGLRNVADVNAALSEMRRVVRPGGRVVCLEINRVTSPVFSVLWRLYFYGLSPHLARLFKGNRDAYNYLPDSVKSWYSREELAAEFEKAGLAHVLWRDMTLGTVCLHTGIKPHITGDNSQ